VRKERKRKNKKRKKNFLFLSSRGSRFDRGLSVLQKAGQAKAGQVCPHAQQLAIALCFDVIKHRLAEVGAKDDAIAPKVLTF
jgi:hypothetical protein